MQKYKKNTDIPQQIASLSGLIGFVYGFLREISYLNSANITQDEGHFWYIFKNIERK